ncbi:MAG: sulfite exporter TauE/SafE family protein [Thiotrichales bacterium]
MAFENSVITAFVVGLLGGVHCLGMCGGIVGALSLGTQSSSGASPFRIRFVLILSAYNLGRILTYTLVGAMAGWLGAAALDLARLNATQHGLLLVAGVFMVLLGLYLGGWWLGLLHVERFGGRLWRHIEPLGRRLLPIRSPAGAFGLGLVWGWLPCGLVYSVLIWALASGSASQGAWLMLAFGLGTLPNLLLMGALAGWLTQFIRNTAVRRTAGGLVVALGLYQIALAAGFTP